MEPIPWTQTAHLVPAEAPGTHPSRVRSLDSRGPLWKESSQRRLWALRPGPKVRGLEGPGP